MTSKLHKSVDRDVRTWTRYSLWTLIGAQRSWQYDVIRDSITRCDRVRDEITVLRNRRSPSIDSLSLPFLFLFLRDSSSHVLVLRAIGFRLRESFTHGFQTRDMRLSLMLCRMQKRIMAYAPRCVSELRVSGSSRSWRWKRERANWNLCLVHVTGADVYNFAKCESRSRRSRENRCGICVVFFDGRREVPPILVSGPLRTAAYMCIFRETSIHQLS